MTASAVDVVNERWLVIEKGAYARQLAGFGGVMDRMILGHGRRHEPSRRINHVRGFILAASGVRGTETASKPSVATIRNPAQTKRGFSGSAERSKCSSGT